MRIYVYKYENNEDDETLEKIEKYEDDCTAAKILV